LLSCFTSLQSLDLGESDITDAHIESLSRDCTSLTRLCVKMGHRLTDASCVSLSRLGCLQTLALRECRQLREHAMRALASMSSLTYLDLFVHPCDSRTGSRYVLLPCCNLPNLQTLALSWCEAMSHTDIASLAGVRSLRSLSLIDGTHGGIETHSSISDTDIASLSAFSTLRRLSLEAFTGITDTGISALAGLTSLTSLSLRHCTLITDAGVESLLVLTALEYLCLHDCWNITDSAIQSLSVLTSLQMLDLGYFRGVTDVDGNHVGITDAGIHVLCQLPALHSVNLNYASNTCTDTALQSLGGSLAERRISGRRWNLTLPNGSCAEDCEFFFWEPLELETWREECDREGDEGDEGDEETQRERERESEKCRINGWEWQPGL